MPLYSYKCGGQLRVVVFQEPHGDVDATITVPVDEAIAAQKISADCVRPGFKYETDEQALEDFQTVHWAKVVEEPCGHVMEDVLQGIREPALEVCPKCGNRSLERLIGGTSFVLRGGGWARDGYGSTKTRSK